MSARRSTTLLTALVAGLLAAADPPAPTPSWGVRDEAKFFSAEAVAKANPRIKESREQYGRDLLVETFPEVPADRRKDYRAENKGEFFAGWARDNARQRKVSGVYVLVCRSPAHLQVERESAGRAFSAADRGKLRDLLLPRFREKKFDEGLAEAVTLVTERFRDSAPVRDEGRFFTADAVRKAVEEIDVIHRRYEKDLVVETFKEIPAARKKDYSPEKRGRFFADWARERARQRGVKGIYILICREPGHLEVITDAPTREKAFPPRDRRRLAEKLLAHFREEKFDAGLAEAVRLVDAALKENLKDGGAAKDRE